MGFFWDTVYVRPAAEDVDGVVENDMFRHEMWRRVEKQDSPEDGMKCHLPSVIDLTSSASVAACKLTGSDSVRRRKLKLLSASEKK